MGVEMGTFRALSTRRASAATIDFDTFSVAVGLALIAGGLALVAPDLDSLTVALAALAAAGWAAGRSLDRTQRVEAILSTRAIGILAMALGSVAFLALPPPLGVGRGLVLALSLVPLWLIERRRVPVPGTPLRGGE
jgi:uncharacterized membrane protein